MKNPILTFLGTTILLVACSAPSSLEEKKTELSKLKDKRTEIAQKISDLEAEILELEPIVAKAKPVNAMQLAVSGFQHAIEFQGSADTDNNITLVGEANGNIERVLVDEGDYVKAGQVLIKLDKKALDASKLQLLSGLELAKTSFERQERLWKQKIGTEIQYLQAKNQVQSLEAQLQQLEANMENFQITAPISGYVDQLFVKAGETMMPGSPVIRIVNLNSITVKADVSEAYIQAAKVGKNIEVKFPSIDKTINAKISAVGQVIDPANRTFRIEIQIPNSEKLIKPNMLAIMKMTDYQKAEAIAVPAKYIQSDRFGNYFVFLKSNKGGEVRAIKKDVTIGMRYNGLAEITSGLKPKDIMITDGSRELSDNMIIEVKDIQKL